MHVVRISWKQNMAYLKNFWIFQFTYMYMHRTSIKAKKLHTKNWRFFLRSQVLVYKTSENSEHKNILEIDPSNFMVTDYNVLLFFLRKQKYTFVAGCVHWLDRWSCIVTWHMIKIQKRCYIYGDNVRMFFSEMFCKNCKNCETCN